MILEATSFYRTDGEAVRVVEEGEVLAKQPLIPHGPDPLRAPQNKV